MDPITIILGLLSTAAASAPQIIAAVKQAKGQLPSLIKKLVRLEGKYAKTANPNKKDRLAAEIIALREQIAQMQVVIDQAEQQVGPVEAPVDYAPYFIGGGALVLAAAALGYAVLGSKR